MFVLKRRDGFQTVLNSEVLIKQTTPKWAIVGDEAERKREEREKEKKSFTLFFSNPSETSQTDAGGHSTNKTSSFPDRVADECKQQFLL